MRNIIINRPELQTFRQRAGSFFIGLLSWSLWLYFLLPLFTLGGWLMGVKSFSDEIRWFGGYKTLLDLLLLYGFIVVLIAFGWLIWSFCLTWLHARRPLRHESAVTDTDLSVRFNVQLTELQATKSHQITTVHFDDHANIIRLERQ